MTYGPYEQIVVDVRDRVTAEEKDDLICSERDVDRVAHK